MTDWQPIETAPRKEGVEFLAAECSYGVWTMRVVEYAYEENGEALYWALGGRAYRPSRWMPLPEVPFQASK